MMNLKTTNETVRLNKILDRGSVELRCFDSTSETAKKQKSKKLIWSGVFDDIQPMINSVKFAIKNNMDVYHTINPTTLNVNNNLKPFRKTTKDTDIETRKEIFFDFDPVRETGQAANEYEVEVAISRAEALMEFLSGEGWSMPTIGYSGNGAHLYYDTDLVIDDHKLLAGLYEGLSLRFSDDEVSFDVVVKNAARIARCLGTHNNKADRRSKCISIGEYTSPETILATIEKLTPPKPKKHYVRPPVEPTDGKFIKNWDIVKAFQSAGMYIGQRGDVHDVVCPWHGTHSSKSETDTGAWEGEWPQWHCFHNSCRGKSIVDVIEYFGAQ